MVVAVRWLYLAALWCQVRLGLKARLAQPAPLAQPVRRARRGMLDLRAQWGRLVRKGLQERTVQLDPRGSKALLGRREKPGKRVRQGLRGQLARPVLKAIPAHKVPPGPLVHRVLPGRPEPLAHKERRVQKAR
jgi:hypothetical protein